MGKGRGRSPGARWTPSSSPYRERGTQTAIAKFPEDIQACPHEARSRTHPAGESARRAGLPAGHVRARASPQDRIKGRDKTRWDALDKRAEGRSTRSSPSEPGDGPDGRPTSGRSRPPTLIPGARKSRADRARVPDGARSDALGLGSRGGPSRRNRPDGGWPWRLAEPAGQPAVDPRDRQPDLAVPLRPGTGRRRRATSARLGEPPSHPELLDWLASRVRRPRAGDWKPIHRLILTSATYRQAVDAPA